MKLVYLIHWKRDEASVKAEHLKAAGYNVRSEQITPAALREIREKAPDAIIIDLSRLPSQGRDLALNFRHHKSTRNIPIIFVDGDKEKVAGIKKHLPDATYTAWGKIRSALKTAITNPPSDLVVPKSVFAGYSDTPLVKKLGIKENILVLLINPPSGFIESLGALPEGVRITKKPEGKLDLIIWFVKSERYLRADITKVSGYLAEKGGLWIAWPKKESGLDADIDQIIVRKTGLGNGLVDYKICAIDNTWSGLKFCRRKI